MLIKCSFLLRKLLIIYVLMGIIRENSSPSDVAHRIYVFSVINEVWVIEECIGMQVWQELSKKITSGKKRSKKYKNFKMSFTEKKTLTIWRTL